MYPVMFTLGSFQLYSWGAVLVVSLLLSIQVAERAARRHGLDPDGLVNFVFVLVAVGIAGARSAYVALHWSQFLHTGVLAALNLRGGGMTFHGALLFGLVALVFSARFLRVSVAALADVLAPAMALGYGVQRVGCLLNGDSYGIRTGGGWGVTTRFAPGLRQPVQLYDSALNIALFRLLWWLERRRVRPGVVTLSYLAGSAVARFLTEFFREGARGARGLTLAQWVSMLLIATSLTGLALLRARPGGLRSTQ